MPVLEFNYFWSRPESTFLEVLLLLTGSFSLVCVCQSGCCPKVLGTRTRKKTTDGSFRLRGLKPTRRRLLQGVCISRSRSNHKPLPQYLIVLCHPQCVLCAVWVRLSHDVCLTGFLSHNECFLPDTPHQT